MGVEMGTAHRPLLEAGLERSRPLPVASARLRTAARRDGADCEFTINGRFLTQPVTGVQRYAREICRELDMRLASRGSQARLCTPATETPTETAALSFDTGAPVSGHLWEQAWLPTRVRGPLLSLCNLGPLALRRQLVCIHDANVFLVPESYAPTFRRAYRVFLPLIARRSAVLATVSRFSAAMIATHLGLPADRILIMPNGHEHVRQWHAGRSDLLSRRPPRRPFVLLVGSRARHKNIGIILGLADRLDRIGLDVWVAGPALTAFSAAGHAEASNVKWLGFVSDDDLAALYTHALCLAFPSLTEGFGIPLLEAMALGCPIVSSDRASMPEICGDAALYADPQMPDQWFARLSKLARSEALRAELKEAGARRVADYSWRDSAERYDDALRALQ